MTSSPVASAQSRAARSRQSLTVLLFVAVLATTLAPEGAAGIAVSGQMSGKRLSLDMYHHMQGVGSPQVSPDGSRIVYTLTWTAAVNDARESELWVMNADGSRKRKLVEGSDAIWSRDGTRIAYVAPGEPRGSQIWVRWMDAEGAASQVTRVESSPRCEF